MCKRYLRVHDIINDAHKSIMREQGAQAASLIELLSGEDTTVIEDRVKIPHNTEDVTTLLRKSSFPSIQDVNIFTAIIICSLNEFIGSSCQFHQSRASSEMILSNGL